MVQLAKGLGIALRRIGIAAALIAALLALSMAAATVSQGQGNSAECLAYDDHGVCSQWSGSGDSEEAQADAIVEQVVDLLADGEDPNRATCRNRPSHLVPIGDSGSCAETAG